VFIYHSDIKLQYVSKQLQIKQHPVVEFIKYIIEYRAIGADNEKILFLIPLIAVVMSFSSPASADDDDDYYEDDDYSYSQPPETIINHHNRSNNTITINVLQTAGRRGSW